MSNGARKPRRISSTRPPMSRAYLRFRRDVVPQLPQERIGVHNVYVCPECDAFTVTVDRDAGVTPMFLACRACGNASAVSSGYPDTAMQIDPAWEWYRPELDEFVRLSPEMRAHVLNGGLALRPLAVEAEA